MWHPHTHTYLPYIYLESLSHSEEPQKGCNFMGSGKMGKGSLSPTFWLPQSSLVGCAVGWNNEAHVGGWHGIATLEGGRRWFCKHTVYGFACCLPRITHVTWSICYFHHAAHKLSQNVGRFSELLGVPVYTGNFGGSFGELSRGKWTKLQILSLNVRCNPGYPVQDMEISPMSNDWGVSEAVEVLRTEW